MPVLYDQFGREIQRPEKKPDRRPLAAAPITDAFREYVADGLTPARLASILREADAGDIGRQAELFDTIEERDGHVVGETSKRRNVILDADFTLEPASDDRRDVQVYEACKEMIEDITDWPDVLVSLQDAVGKGFACLDLDWDVSEGQAQVHGFKFIEQGRFLFHDRSGVLSHVPLLITDEDPMGVDIPSWRVMMHRYGGKSGHVTRSGLHRICTWWYLFKHYAIKDWVVFCEVFGMPLRLGKYDPGASQSDKDALETAVRAIGQDAAGIISKSTEIEFPETGTKTGTADLYQGLAAFGNKEISKALLGSTLTADVDGKGSYAAATTHNEVRLDLINADARAIAATIRNQFLRPWVGFNFGWDTRVPKYTGEIVPEDLAAHADLLDKFADRMDIPVSHVRSKYKIPAPEKGEELLRPKMAAQFTAKQNTPRYTAIGKTDARSAVLDDLYMVLERLGDQADEMVTDRVDRIREIMDRSGSMTEMKTRLADAFAGLPDDDLGNLIAEAMATANLMARFRVADDAGLVEGSDA